MFESSRRIRAALVGATLLGVVATTAQAAPPPTQQPIAEIGPVNMSSILNDSGFSFDYNRYLPFAITVAGRYIFSINMDRFEWEFGGYGVVYFDISGSDHSLYFTFSDSILSKSEEIFLGVGDYAMAITAHGNNYRAIGVHASVTPVPGPIAGAGLPLLLGFAGYAAWRRRAAKAAT